MVEVGTLFSFSGSTAFVLTSKLKTSNSGIEGVGKTEKTIGSKEGRIF